MNKALEIQLLGWTATPRLPFVLSGNAICMPVPSYSLLLGLVGCCLGRLVDPGEVKLGYKYAYDTVGKDLETRQRFEFDGKKVKPHSKGTDAYSREFHVAPKLTLWLDRLDWEEHFLNPIGTPSLGRSQDILKIERVRTIDVKVVEEATVSGCMLPFNTNLKIQGQLIQLADAFRESEEIGGGRTATTSSVFISVPSDNEQLIKTNNLYQTQEENSKSFYLHHFEK